MSLHEKLQQHLRTAQKEKRAFEVGVLRMVLAAVHNLEIERRSKGSSPLVDADLQTLLQKESKKRKEAAVLYRKGNREDLAEQEEHEDAILALYLPPSLGEEEMRAAVARAIASGLHDFGQVMKRVREETEGRADARMLAELVKRALEETGA